MDFSKFSPYYNLFNQIIEKKTYVKVEVLADAQAEETIEDSVLIKDVYYGNGNLLVKYFSKNFQIILVVPHDYFKTLLSRPIKDFLDGNLFSQLLNHNKAEIGVLKNNSVFPTSKEENILTKKNSFPIYDSDEGSGIEGKFVFSVTALTSRLKQMIVRNFYSVWIKGEVNDAKISANGHLFFNLRDENASLSCVIYSRQLKNLKFKVESGIIFECFGNMTLYEKRGTYQLVVESLIPEGQGELDLAFKQLKDKLGKEGLFSIEFKQAIPRYPKRIGIITSTKGAAIYDFLKTTQSDFPKLDIVILPCLVQGERAAESIVKMIDYANQEIDLQIEVLVLTRGGGSSEDLWPFNEEITARAIFNSKIPIISAIGHEVDWTISDLVADYRSPTPTSAARFICEGIKNLEQDVFHLDQILQKNMRLVLEGVKYRTKLFSPSRFSHLIFTMIEIRRKILSDYYRSMFFAIQQIFSNNRHLLSIIKVRINSLSPQKVFSRGYMIVKKDNNFVSDLKTLKAGDRIEISSYTDSSQAQIL